MSGTRAWPKNRWRFAVGSTRAHVVDAGFKDAAAAVQLVLEAVNGVGQLLSNAVAPIADVVDGHHALQLFEIRFPLLG